MWDVITVIMNVGYATFQPLRIATLGTTPLDSDLEFNTLVGHCQKPYYRLGSKIKEASCDFKSV